MGDDRSLPHIIQSKLHRPPIYENVILRQHLLDRLDQRRNRPLTLISAPAGYGKTTLASSWLETIDSPNAWLSLDETDNDLRLFLGYLLSAIQTIFPDFGRKTLAMVNASTLAPVTALVGSLINELDRIEESFILALDDTHLIKDESVLELLNQLLRHPPQSMHFVLIGRRDPALPISKLRANRLMTEIRTQDLRFSDMEIKEFLTLMLKTEVDSTTTAAVAEKTEGWVTGLVLAAFSMRNQGHLDPALLEPQVSAQSVMEYLFTEVFSRQPSEITRYLMTSAILDRFCGPLCEAVCAAGGGRPTIIISGWEFITWLNKQNLFLIPLDNENRWFRFHHLFQTLLLNQLNRHLSEDEINALHMQASTWLAENGLIEEAIKHALAGGDAKAAAQLIVEHGFDLLNDVQWPRLDRWLRMLSGEIIDQEPELLILSSWLHQIYARFPEMKSYLDRAEALCSNRTNEDYVEGHISVLRSFQYYYVANGERSVISARRASKKLPLKHRWARIFAFIMQGVANQMLGDRDKALATWEEAITESDRFGDTSHSHFQSNPCFVYWMEADLLSMLEITTRALKSAENSQAHHANSQCLYFMGIARYHRNDLQAAEEILTSEVNEAYSQYAWNYIHSALPLALVHQARGRTDAANQVA